MGDGRGAGGEGAFPPATAASQHAIPVPVSVGAAAVSTPRPFAAPQSVAAILKDFDRPWAICGGWAVDLFLDRVTRSHHDVEIAVFRPDQRALHTYVSARMAILKDAAKVALECGNSPAMIFSNYRELMHDDTAADWFAVMPATPAENIVQMEAAQ